MGANLAGIATKAKRLAKRANPRFSALDQLTGSLAMLGRRQAQGLMCARCAQQGGMKQRRGHPAERVPPAPTMGPEAGSSVGDAITDSTALAHRTEKHARMGPTVTLGAWLCAHLVTQAST